MKGSQLTVYAANQRHRIGHMTIVDWILDEVKRAGIRGATVTGIDEGVDTHGRYHAARFFELSDQPVAVTVIASDAEIDALLSVLQSSEIRLFFTRAPIEYDTFGTDGDD